MNYPGYLDTESQGNQSPATPEDAEIMLGRVQDMEMAIQARYDEGLMLDCLKAANDIPGVEYESFEDYLEHAEWLHMIIKHQDWSVSKPDNN